MPESSSDETVVLATSQPHLPTADEGRFVSGTLLAGRYRILNMLGKGGMGEVYRATDLTLGQSVALKFLPASYAANPSILERFHGEVRIARQVSHPNVCRVYDIGEWNGQPFLSMEYVDGEDLSGLLTRIGRLPAEKALETARKICAGLAAAHAKGIIHRDLKPQNIMLDKRGQVLIMDFGLAAVANQLSGPEARNGTPAYMSPEQLKGIEVTAKSDIYSLGLILYELFTGKRPFIANTIPDLISAQETTQLANVSTIAADIDPAVDKVIRACLAADPQRRPETPLAVSASLPGGDPLAAALAAGETPSPDMVAAAGTTTGLKPRYAMALFGVLTLCTLGAPFLKQALFTVNHAPLPDTPEVLAFKARQMAKDFGYAETPKDHATFLVRRSAFVRYLGNKPQPRQWDSWLRAESPIMAVHYASPDFILPKPSGTELGDDNPPLITPGMVILQLDGEARLRSFRAVPLAKAPKIPFTLDRFFAAAQLDASRFAPIPPTETPTVPFDTQWAFQGSHPALPDTPLTIHLSAFRGQLVDATIRFPFNPARGPNSPNPPQSLLSLLRNLFFVSIALIGGVFAVLLARRNWALGRSDRRGAKLVAIATIVLGLVSWVCYVHPVPSGELLGFFLQASAEHLLSGVLFFVLYTALEPALRSRWPHAIVTWNRLLAGQLRDPQLSGHFLIGATLGAFVYMSFGLREWFLLDSTGPLGNGHPSLLYGTRQLAGVVVARLALVLPLGLIGFFALFGLRTLLRRDWIAALVASAIFPIIETSVINATNPVLVYALYFLVYLIVVSVMLRFGLVATVALLLYGQLTGQGSLGSDPTTWYAPYGLALHAFSLGLGALACYFSLGNQTLLRDTPEA